MADDLLHPLGIVDRLSNLDDADARISDNVGVAYGAVWTAFHFRARAAPQSPLLDDAPLVALLLNNLCPYAEHGSCGLLSSCGSNGYGIGLHGKDWLGVNVPGASAGNGERPTKA
jgi:hypothetical protein